MDWILIKNKQKNFDQVFNVLIKTFVHMKTYTHVIERGNFAKII